MTYALTPDEPKFDLAALARLSVARVTGRIQPNAPDNEHRARMLRMFLPVEKHNAHAWPHCKRTQYEAEQIADSAPSTDTYERG